MEKKSKAASEFNAYVKSKLSRLIVMKNLDLPKRVSMKSILGQYSPNNKQASILTTKIYCQKGQKLHL